MRKLTLVLVLTLIAVVVTASPVMAKQKKNDSINNGPLPAGCLKFEGGDLGMDPLVGSVDGYTVTVSQWLDKGEADEYIGFSYASTGNVTVVSVKSSTDIFPGDLSGTWMDPNFAAGEHAHAISNIVFCVEPPPVSPMEELMEE